MNDLTNQLEQPGGGDEKKFISFEAAQFKTVFYGPDEKEFMVLDPVNGLVLKSGEPVEDSQGVYWALCEWMSRSGMKLPASPYMDVIDKQATALINESALVKQLLAQMEQHKQLLLTKTEELAAANKQIKELTVPQ